MPRIRSIKPEFFLDEELAEMEPLCRILFVGLWCLADREGRLEDRPARIRASVLPYDQADVDAMLHQLHLKGFITRYLIGKKRYIEISSFLRHQRPHYKESESVIPPSTSKDANVESSSGQRRVNVESSSGQRCTQEGKGREGKEKNTCASKVDAQSRFEEFWAAYPKKRGKQDALKAWTKVTADTPPERIIEAVGCYPFDRRDGMQFVPYPATWLRRGHYEDEAVPFDEGAGTDLDDYLAGF